MKRKVKTIYNYQECECFIFYAQMLALFIYIILSRIYLALKNRLITQDNASEYAADPFI